MSKTHWVDRYCPNCDECISFLGEAPRDATCEECGVFLVEAEPDRIGRMLREAFQDHQGG
jgi:hypothetical protein